MFQNPQQRAGGGIMAGVAPINMSNGGDPNDTWAKAIPSFFGEYAKDAKFAYDEFPDMPTPSEAGRMYDEGINVDDLYGEGNFVDFSETPSGSMNPMDYFPTKTEVGSGMNLRDVTDFLVVNPDDPVDLAIAAAAVGMLAFPPGLIGVGLAKLGYLGVKATRVLKRVAGLQKKLGDDELRNIQGSGLSGKLEERAREIGANPIDNLKIGRANPDAAGFLRNRVAPTSVGSYEATRFLSLPAQEAYDKINFISPAQAQENEVLYPEIPEYEGGPVERLDAPAGIAAIDNQAPQITDMVREAETDAEGGIAKVARSIAEARSDEFKSPTFRRGDKDLAAVTKEDLIDAGYEGPDALTNYLNDMKFDDELGEYIKDIEAKGKADGGVAGFYTGGAAAVQRGLAAVRAARLAAANKVNPPYSQADLDLQMAGRQRAPASPDMPAGGTVTDDVAKTGNPFSRNPIKTALGTGLVGLYGANEFLKPDEEEEAGAGSGSGSVGKDGQTIMPSGAMITDASDASYDADTDSYKKSLRGTEFDDRNFITKTTDFFKESLSSLKNEYSSDPRKAMFIMGQMLKAREGIVPINGLTVLTEADEQYETIKAERNKTIDEGKPDIFKMFDAIVAQQEKFGNSLNEAGQATILKSLFALSRDSEKMLGLSKMMYQNPALAGDSDFIKYLIKTSTSDDGNIANLIANFNNLKDSDLGGKT